MTSAVEAFFALHDGLPRQAPGSDATTARLLALAAPAEKPRVLDLGCGPGRASLVLAAATGGHVTALDLHQPYLDQLTAEAARRGLSGRIDAVHGDMTDLGRFPDGGFDLVWAEGSAYIAGFDAALRAWRRLLTPGGALVVTELEWATATPSAGARAFWAGQYPLRDPAANAAAAQAAGYRVAAVLPLPDEDWFTEYYTPLEERLHTADTTGPGMREAAAATAAEIAARRAHGADYRYAGYVLRPTGDRPSLFTDMSSAVGNHPAG